MQNFLLILVLFVSAALSPALAQRPQPERLAPFVPSPQVVVERMLAAADIKPNETVYDLGCGDGRVVITAARVFKAKGVGVEISKELARQAREQVKALGLTNRVNIIEGDLLQVDLKPADVVTLYLLTSSNERLKPLLEANLRPGARGNVGELECDVAAAGEHDPLRQLFQFQKLIAAREMLLSGDIQRRGPGAGGDDDMPGLEDVIVNLDGIAADEARPPVQRLNA
ncbi:MAG TPA: class I SAM-dependent methyltransferase, partial [Bryobacteraceae bacterium]|nr:class I SAM-dependent methyltransferase [Bryobacteraceae bacterium]